MVLAWLLFQNGAGNCKKGYSTPHDPGHDSLTKIHEKQCVMSTGEVRDSLRDDLLDATACLYKLGADKACHRWSFMFKSSGTETTLCEFKFFRLETPLKVHGIKP